MAAEKAAEKVAAEKKAAEEKAAAEKTAVEQKENMESLKGSAIRFIACLVLIMLPVFIASIMNTHDYFLKEADGAVEVWQGRFAPMGTYRMLSMPGGILPETIQEEYTKKEIFPFIFNYYIEKADALLKVPGLPDFEGIKSELNTAMCYAVSKAHKRTVSSRLTSLDLMILWYKADVEIGKGTAAALESASVLLKEASSLDLDRHDADRVEKRIKTVQEAMAALKAADE